MSELEKFLIDRYKGYFGWPVVRVSVSKTAPDYGVFGAEWRISFRAESPELAAQIAAERAAGIPQTRGLGGDYLRASDTTTMVVDKFGVTSAPSCGRPAQAFQGEWGTRLHALLMKESFAPAQHT